ncbi:MAG: TIGR00645 family protein [Alphaproteobacteria bacterium]|nr:MAG: TIGR00645 family protein [Alphaproteobacteria bacterium]
MSTVGKNRSEQAFERVLFASRWLLAPVYLGLAVLLLLLLVVFLRDLLGYLPRALTLPYQDAILVTLTLIDLALVANLVVIVIFSGYENFVSKFDLGPRDDRPTWMGKIDFSGLKIKLIGSMVGISGIDLLKRFMEIGREHANVSWEELKWLITLHLVFVVSGVLLAAMDWLKERASPHH